MSTESRFAYSGGPVETTGKLPATPDLLVVALLVAIVVVPRLAGLYTTSIFDDAFITFRYAENLAAGRGLVYNIGSQTLGTTTPLFTLLLAGLRSMGLSIPASAIAIGVLSDVMSALLLHRMVRPLGSGYAALAVLVFAVDPHLVRISVGGMESSLFLVLSLFLVMLLTEKRSALAFPLASVTLYVRPEGVLLWFLSLLMLWKGRERPRTRVAALLVGLAFTLVPLIVVQIYYGSIAPQSVVSKARSVGGDLGQVFNTFFFPGRSPVQGILTILTPAGLWLGWKRSPYLRIFMIWLAAYASAYLIARPYMWTWYGMPVYAGKAVFAGVALARFTEWLLPRAVPSDRLAWIGACALSATAALGTVLIFGTSPVRQNIYEPLKAWCASNLPEGKTIAAGDIGALGYYCNSFIYDFAGLVWAERWQYGNHIQIVEIEEPDYIFAELRTHWRPLFDPSSPLRSRYRPVRRFSREGFEETDVTPSSLSRVWLQDYVLFELVRAPDAVRPSEVKPAVPLYQ